MAETPEQAVADLQQRCGSLMMATLSEDGSPHSSYAPFCINGRHYLVLVSELALHTRNLLARPVLEIMLIEDESDASQLFARNRLTLSCEANEITSEHAEHTSLLDKFQRRHGKTVELLRQLPDFHLLRLTPRAGRFVRGFGQAYELGGDKLDQFVRSRSA
ncbi:MAG: pyridoxamine 5'-phosphate oxidase family protein [Granulosicoccaceae bacterium]